LNYDDIEKLRPLANNTKHLIEIILNKMKKEANAIGHDMSVSFEDPYYGIWVLDTYCKKCAYEIEIELLLTDTKKEQIYVKETKALKKVCQR